MKDKLIEFLEWLKAQLDKIPAFSEVNMHLACKVCSGVIAASALFLFMRCLLTTALV